LFLLQVTSLATWQRLAGAFQCTTKVDLVLQHLVAMKQTEIGITLHLNCNQANTRSETVLVNQV